MANTHSLDLERSSLQNAYITDANQNGLDITGDITIEFWTKLEQFGVVHGFVAKDAQAVGDRGYNLHVNAAGQLRFQYFSDNSTYTQIFYNDFFDANDVGVWVHVAVAVDVSAKTAVFYKNASPLTPTSSPANATSIQNNGENFEIGGRRSLWDGASLNYFLDGKMDEVRVWNDIRSQAEIQANYKKELVGNEANLQGYWKLNNNYLDETSNGNDLTAVNSPVFSTDVPTWESPSPSLSPSSSPSLSPSASISPSPSLSPSASQSPSSSPSASQSPSASPSSSESRSTSASPSASQSPSSSISLSPSASPSASESRSPSLSPSASPSSSISPSPSTGYTDYTRGNYAALPTNDDDLETAYTAGDVTDVSSKNDVYVDQSATNEFMIHQFKSFVGDQTACQVEAEAKSTLGCNLSTTYLQIYNHTSGDWDTIDSDNSTAADTDFSLISDVADLTDYKDSSNVISCRVYQEAV